ncbi:unnamed protein product [Parajaminaea phylloscopi]
MGSPESSSGSRPSSAVRRSSAPLSTPHFLATLSPQRSTASTTTTRGVAVRVRSTTVRPSQLEARASSDHEGLESDDETSLGRGSQGSSSGANDSEDEDKRHGLSLSMRIDSAMKAEFPTLATTSAAPDTLAAATTALALPSQYQDGKASPFSSSQTNDVPPHAHIETPENTASAWSTWTSRAASGSMALLRQGSSAAAGFGNVLRTNPFKGGDSSERDTRALDESGGTAATVQTSRDSDEDDAHLVRSAADSLRIGARNEEKRRRRAGNDAKVPKAPGNGPSKRPIPGLAEPDANREGREAAPSESTSSYRVSSPSTSRVRGLRVYDIGASLPDADKPPSTLPERQYFVLTQAGKPVFLSHLATKRMMRDEAARVRLRSIRNQKRELEVRLDDSRLTQEERKTAKQSVLQCDNEEREHRRHDAEAADRDEEESAVQVGVIQALVSNFSHLGPEALERKSIEILKLPPRCTRVVYLLREPLYLAVTSTWYDGGFLYSDSVSTLKAQLEVLHAGIISLVSEHQLHRLFSRGHNFDLRRMLEGTDGILESLVARMQSDFGLTLGAGGGGVCLRPLRMDLKLREDLTSCLSLERWRNESIAQALATPKNDGSENATSGGGLDARRLLEDMPARPKDLLYVLLISSDSQLITLLRPRKLSAYPLDLHLLVNTISGMSRRSSREAGTINWVPICLPRFAPQGIVQAHISWLGSADESTDASASSSKSAKSKAQSALVIVTADREAFEEVSTYRDAIVSLLSLSPRSPLHALSPCLASAPINPDDLHLPGLRHFVLKKRDDLQVVWSEWGDGYEGLQDGAELARLRVMRAYERARGICVLSAKAHKLGRTSKRKGKEGAPTLSTDAEGGKDGRRTPSGDDKAKTSTEGAAQDASTVAAQDGKEDDVLPPPAPPALTPTQPPEVPCYAHYLRTPHEVIYVECPPLSSFSSSSARRAANVAVVAEDLNSTGGSAATPPNVPPYEVYLVLSPNVPPHAAVRIARGVLRWGFESGRSGGGNGAREAHVARNGNQEAAKTRNGGGGGGGGTGGGKDDGHLDDGSHGDEPRDTGDDRDGTDVRLDKSTAGGGAVAGGERWRLWLGRGTVF